jgi:hypothetical protein
MKIDSFKPTTVYTIYIAATPERVWQALTTLDKTVMIASFDGDEHRLADVIDNLIK